MSEENPQLDLPTTKSTSASSQPRGSVGPYRLLQKLGEGGMGTVYLAEQSRPVNRRVALKIIKPGSESTQVIARFEQERQALALMDHPHIAKVLDAGTTPEGLPYFVMELVKGVPLTKYCEEQHLAIPERLELFMQVCDAVQHAHQKGIIHRDLKPSNVLVAVNDGKPAPKIIDFGVAKAVSHKLTERTMFTEVGQMVGTPEYMAPEQAESSNLDVDTRADIYSLGVMLYELLTGTPPFSPQQLRAAGYSEMLRLIREVDPIKPSAKLSTATQPKTASKNPELDPARMRKLVHGDLDWIVMKCLEKDRARRYESASELAQDLRRHLNFEPVLASPPSAVYRWGKFLRRHRGAVAAAALFLVTLTIGTGVSIWQAVLARQAEARAIAKQEEAVTERAAKEAALKQATLHAEQATKSAAEATQNLAAAQAAAQEQQRLATLERQAKEAEVAQRKQAEAVAQLLESLFDGLNPKGETADIEVALTRRLDDLANKITADQASDPVVKSRLQNALGVTYIGLGDLLKAIPLLEQAVAERLARLGPDHADTRASRHNLAVAYDRASEHRKLLQLVEEMLQLERVKKVPDPAYLQTLQLMKASAVMEIGDLKQMQALLKEQAAITAQQSGLQQDQVLDAWQKLAAAQVARGQSAAGIELLENAWRQRKDTLEKDPTRWASILNNLAHAYTEAGQMDKVLPLQQEALQLIEERLSLEHPDAASMLVGMGYTYKQAGHFEQAIALYKQAHTALKKRLGEDNPQTLVALGNLSVAYLDSGRITEALPIMQQVLDLTRKRQGETHPNTLFAIHRLASGYDSAWMDDKALPLYEKTIELRTKILGPQHRDTLITITNLGTLHEKHFRFDRALPLYEQALEGFKSTLGPDHPHTLSSMNDVARIHRREGRHDEAIFMITLALDAVRTKLGPGHPDTLAALDNLASAYADQGDFAKAYKLFGEIIQTSREVFGEHPRTWAYMSNLAWAHHQAQDWERAVALCEEVLSIRRLKLGSTHPETAQSLENLAATLRMQKKWVEEERITKELLEIRRQKDGEDSKHYYGQLNSLGQNQLRRGKFAEAEITLRKVYAFRQEKLTDDWRLYNTQSLLGECLLAQNKAAEAKPLLLEAYAGMKQREKTMLDLRYRLRETLEQLVKVHEALDDQEQAAVWQKTLGEFR